MEFLQHLNIDGGTAILLAVGLCVLCLVLPLLMTGVHFITAIIGIFSHLIGGVMQVIAGGPAQWCGCLVLIGGCGLVAFAVWLVATGLSTCATYPTNFCALFGR